MEVPVNDVWEPNRFPGEQYGPASVDIANTQAVIDMPTDDRNSTYRDFWLAAAIVTAGLVMSGLSLTRLSAGNAQVAQATQPLQSTPGAETKPSAPADPAPTGARPTGISPQPAHPDAAAQTTGAAPSLAPAPAEKIAPPIKDR